MKLIIASQNENKIKEIRNKLPLLDIEGLDPKLFPNELKEDSDTLQANALQKAWQVYDITKTACFADDTGLEVEALNGEPGVYSARYAGIEKDSMKNMHKLLSELQAFDNRRAQFRTVIALILDNREYLFEGVCKGVITTELHGGGGFGYDPIFQPLGYNHTFAQMSLEQKGEISHRALAIQKLQRFLTTY